MSKKLISLIIPVHNESENLKWHYEKISSFISKRDESFEFIYIDDGSTDDSLNVIKSIEKTNKNVRFLSFSRNFGKEAATTAGMKLSKGDAVVIIDADGQHPIELVDKFISSWQKGIQVVIGIRKNDKGEGYLKTLGSKAFYSILKILSSDSSAHSGLTDFRLIDRLVVDEYNRLTEHNRITRNLIDWLGFKRELIAFTANKRHAGKATYSYKKLLKLAIDAIIKHSTRPLKIIGILGVFVAFLSFLLGIFVIFEMYIFGDPLVLHISGSASLAILLSFMIGIVLVCQGLLALYLENVYYETQNRPLYVIAENS